MMEQYLAVAAKGGLLPLLRPFFELLSCMMVQRAIQGALHKSPHNFGPVALQHGLQLGLLTARKICDKGLKGLNTFGHPLYS